MLFGQQINQPMSKKVASWDTNKGKRDWHLPFVEAWIEVEAEIEARRKLLNC